MREKNQLIRLHDSDNDLKSTSALENDMILTECSDQCSFAVEVLKNILCRTFIYYMEDCLLPVNNTLESNQLSQGHTFCH